MTVFGGGGRKALGSLRSPRKCGDSSPFDFAQGQNDDVKRTTARTTATATATATAVQRSNKTGGWGWGGGGAGRTCARVDVAIGREGWINGDGGADFYRVYRFARATRGIC